MIRDNVPGLGRLVVLQKLGLQESVLAHEITRISVIVDSTVTCGADVPLSASVFDPDDDVQSARWFVDGVLMEDGLTSMTFSEAHEVELVARDERGAATTAKKVIQCN